MTTSRTLYALHCAPYCYSMHRRALPTLLLLLLLPVAERSPQMASWKKAASVSMSRACLVPMKATYTDLLPTATR